ncbi:hypothetical protein ANCDUO_27673, partial [Ancylostoma duodenale]
CISDVYVNDVAVNFENAVEKDRITPGCGSVVDLCTGVITCNKEKFRRHHVEGDCRSVDMVKNAECVGYCGEGENCCTAVKTKRRRLKMTCRNGQLKHTVVTIVRKCQCSNTCRARTYRSLMIRR